jgi:hypothetical protein
MDNEAPQPAQADESSEPQLSGVYVPDLIDET